MTSSSSSQTTFSLRQSPSAYSPSRLERAARQAARHLPLNLALKLDAAGQIDLSTHQVDLNPIHGALLPTLVHESLHQVLDAQLRRTFGARLNEAAIVAFTLEVVRFIHARPHLESWWMARCSTLLTKARNAPDSH